MEVGNRAQERSFKRAAVVRVFVKKTRRTPGREIALALRRAGEILE